jgi:SAM-dependent methyltransferase
MSKVIEHINFIREKVCPRTSYATSGSAAKELFILIAENEVVEFEQKFSEIKKTSEFDSFKFVFNIEEVYNQISGNVLLLFNLKNQLNEAISLINKLLANNQTKLAIFINQNQFPALDNRYFKSHSIVIDEFNITSCYSSTINSSNKTAVQRVTFSTNGQPSVKSRTQFRFLWSLDDISQIEKGKSRVLQRLSDKELFNGNNKNKPKKFSTQEWDQLIKNAIQKGLDDFAIYSLIRFQTLGSTLESDLEINIQNVQKQSNVMIKNQDNASNNNNKILIKNEKKNEENVDGRADFMVENVIENIPTNFLFPKKLINTVLDYGCAEGAITSKLATKLNIPKDRVFGADVRVIPSEGFTFLHLSSEQNNNNSNNNNINNNINNNKQNQQIEINSHQKQQQKLQQQQILPMLRDNSIDFINASMVFHHVKNITETLLELRRIISKDGVLVIREHHCASPDMAAFLDIVHGIIIIY